ncbi:hypothetical protein LTR37_021389 [Vermiconidia calcicola]|uniref:Uncharacterized protein n=1 Tax=Vermiconidia calcicola TaxID=1690605 RepID=A0ACC3M919_9PEZI|nr:hypothetical protein LTR37_021389 [Vermiconidia calcicola]
MSSHDLGVEDAWETLIQAQLEQLKRHRRDFGTSLIGFEDGSSRIKLLRFDLEMLATRFLLRVMMSQSQQYTLRNTIDLAQEIMDMTLIQKEERESSGKITYLMAKYGMLPAIATAIVILRKNVVPRKWRAEIMQGLLFYRKRLHDGERVELDTLGAKNEISPASLRNTISIQEGRYAIEDTFNKYGEGCERSEVCEQLIRDTVPRYGKVDASDFLVSLKTTSWD